MAIDDLFIQTRDSKKIRAYIQELRQAGLVENEIRIRLQNILSSAGMSSDGVAKEVLFWLPSEFLDFYRDLYLKALEIRGRSAYDTSKGGDVQVAKVDSKTRGDTPNVLGGNAGKRFFKGEWIIKDERALSELSRINEWLVRIVWGAFDAEILRSQAEAYREVGKITVRTGMDKGNSRRVCGDCGKLMKNEWLRCPFH